MINRNIRKSANEGVCRPGQPVLSRRQKSGRFVWLKNGALLGGILASMLSGVAQAAVCYPTNGSKIYQFPINYVLSTPSENTAGMIKPDAEKWSLTANYNLTCDCTGNYEFGFITAKVPDTSLVYSDGNLNFYALGDYLGVASSVYIGGKVNAYIATPFTSKSNQNNAPANCARYPYATGGKGAISLYFRRPLVGVQTVPRTKVVDIYIASDATTQSPTPAATVWMEGTITVPQSCVVNSGTVITVPFGDIMSGDIATKGEMAKNFIPKTVNFKVACTNISEGVKVSLSFHGTPDANDPTTLSTTNKDIAVKMLTTAGATVVPDDGRLPLTMDYAAQMATSQLNLFPVNATGKPPAIGGFTATATIRAEIE